MRDIILEAGWPIFFIFAFGFAALAIALRHALVPQRSLVPLIVGAAAITLLFGVFGTTVGLIHAIEGTMRLPPDQRYIWVIGLKEALHDVGAAFALVILAAPLAAIGSFRMARRLETIDAKSA
jgi:hypothetical protein